MTICQQAFGDILAVYSNLEKSKCNLAKEISTESGHIAANFCQLLKLDLSKTRIYIVSSRLRVGQPNIGTLPSDRSGAAEALSLDTDPLLLAGVIHDTHHREDHHPPSVQRDTTPRQYKYLGVKSCLHGSEEQSE